MRNKFEKEVQQKLDELRLTPSAPVWEKVELEIRQEKKKRRGIFWLFLAAILIAGGWWAYSGLPYKSESHPKETADVTPSNVTNRPAEKTTVPTIEAPRSFDTAIRHSPSVREKNSSHISSATQPDLKPASQKGDRKIVPARFKNPAQKNGTTNIVHTGIAADPFTKTAQLPVQTSADTSSVKTDISTYKTENSTIATDSIVTEKQIPLPADSSNKKAQTEKAQPLVDSSLKKKVASAKGWRKSVSLSFGRSSYAYRVLSTRSYSLADYNAVTGGNVSNPIARPSDSVSIISGGFAFSVGYGLIKELSKKWELGLGVRYAYYSIVTRVGDKRANDTVINSSGTRLVSQELYTNDNDNSYTNRFHVVEVPVSVSYQPSQKLPLILSGGIAYGYLISTNALSFSTASNRYYKSAEDYTRHQAPVSASVQYRFKLKKFSVQTGPVLKYNLVKLQKQGRLNPPHLFFAGLQTDIRF